MSEKENSKRVRMERRLAVFAATAMQSARVWIAALAVLAACGGQDTIETSPSQAGPTSSSSLYWYWYRVAAPTFSPAPGTYSSAVSVALSDTTAGAAIYYTTDGTTPATSSTLYTGPIAVSSSTTVKAIATKSGLYNSAVASGTYTIEIPAATPTFSPAPGSYDSALWVTLSDATVGAAIYYTTDGTTPGPTGADAYLYVGPIEVSTTTTINAIAVAPGLSSSAVASGTYTIMAQTTYDIVGGTISGLSGTITLQLNGLEKLSSSANGWFSFATLLPNGSSYSVTVATQPSGQTCVVSNGTGVISGTDVTDVAVSCSWNSGVVATPSFSPAPGTYDVICWGSCDSFFVTLSDDTLGAAIYYTLDGSPPTVQNGTPTGTTYLYADPIDLTSYWDLTGTDPTTITAVAILKGLSSELASGTYLLNFSFVF